ncbi:MAG: hypothetical protein ABR597_12620 [Bacteroidales bacterium]
MRKIILTLTVFAIAIFLYSCEKDKLDIQEGTFKGTFTVTYSSGTLWGSGTQTGQTTLILKNGKYTCSGNSNRIPAGGSGTYSFDKGKITFNDENSWTADFDWNLILSGQYDYTFDGKKLKISADKNIGNYNYDLEKQ